MRRAVNIPQTTWAVFALLGALFIPFSFDLVQWQSEFASLVFAKDVSSDSASMYILVATLFFISLIIGSTLSLAPGLERVRYYFIHLSRSILPYYLALILCKYGLDKIFKSQFYIPEPNILYTPFGMMDKDILFWSVMGTSKAYSFFLGLMEIIPAILLLWKRTRPVGLLMALPVLLHVVAINFSFDISVKLYSCFLLFLDIYLLTPYLRNFLNRKKEIALKTTKPSPLFLKTFLMTMAICLVVFESLSPYLKSGNFNDDRARRPYLHGAYQVLGNDSSPYKRLFIHRQGYIIFQAVNDVMQDYRAQVDTVNRQIQLTDYQQQHTRLGYDYSSKDSLLQLKYLNGSLFLKAKQVDWRSLPALQDKYHWVVTD